METLEHILGECIHTKPSRIRRHNEIRDLIVDEIGKQGTTVAITKESVLALPGGGNLHPDLVVQNQSGVFVIDVTVRHEDGENLARGRDDKINKYSRLLPILRERRRVANGEVLPIVVGTRGVMLRETVNALAKLNITARGKLLTISLIALRSSIELYHTFMDYDAPQRGPGRIVGFQPPEPRAEKPLTTQ